MVSVGRWYGASTFLGFTGRLRFFVVWYHFPSLQQQLGAFHDVFVVRDPKQDALPHVYQRMSIHALAENRHV